MWQRSKLSRLCHYSSLINLNVSNVSRFSSENSARRAYRPHERSQRSVKSVVLRVHWTRNFTHADARARWHRWHWWWPYGPKEQYVFYMYYGDDNPCHLRRNLLTVIFTYSKGHLKYLYNIFSICRTHTYSIIMY